jgi:hypothetical protein
MFYILERFTNTGIFLNGFFTKLILLVIMLMVASWSISEEKYPQKNQGTAGLDVNQSSNYCFLHNGCIFSQQPPLCVIKFFQKH